MISLYCSLPICIVNKIWLKYPEQFRWTHKLVHIYDLCGHGYSRMDQGNKNGSKLNC